MSFLKGKRALIVGLATERSIAHGIAEAFHREGAELAFSYQGDKLKDRVVNMAEGFDSKLTFPCDVAEDADIDGLFSKLSKHWDGVDIVIHSVGFAPRDQIAGRYVDVVTREGYRIAHDISAYSFAALARAGKDMMKDRQGSLLTLSYLGAVKAIPSYNVMGPAKASLEANVRFLAQDLGPEGIRVNGISAGPIKTLAAAGISGFRKMLTHVEKVAPLKRNVTPIEVGNTAAFLCSDLASGITGEIVYVDCGYSHIGMSLDA
ncbi:MAG TPA: enoyl-ACP reductase [Gammaproteobacteria bacterium]|nr:enoyl-ACP reductase [Gammaproteobacteria bacterium]